MMGGPDEGGISAGILPSRILDLIPVPGTATQDLLARIENDFTYHTPKPGQAERYNHIRDTAKLLAQTVVLCCPAPTAELSICLRKIEEAMFYANAAIARNEHEEPVGNAGVRPPEQGDG